MSLPEISSSQTTLFDLAGLYSKWLSVRQNLVSQNIAHVNSPGFSPKDTVAFSDVLEKTSLSMKKTNMGHLQDPSPIAPQARFSIHGDNAPWSVTYSGNTVNLEEQMLKAAEIQRGASFTTGALKAFHRMLLASVRGG